MHERNFVQKLYVIEKLLALGAISTAEFQEEYFSIFFQGNYPMKNFNYVENTFILAHFDE